MRKFLTAAYSATVVALGIAGPASADPISFQASCPIGCDDSGSHAHGTFGGVNYEELLLHLDITETVGNLPVPPGTSPTSLNGFTWF
jgi:hypothetical protein